MKTPKLTKRNGKLFAGKEEVRAISIDNEWSPADAAMLTLQTENFDLSFDFNPDAELIQNWGAVEWSPKMVLDAVKELIDITDRRVWK